MFKVIHDGKENIVVDRIWRVILMQSEIEHVQDRRSVWGQVNYEVKADPKWRPCPRLFCGWKYFEYVMH